MKASVFNYWLLSSLPGLICTVVVIVVIIALISYKPWKSNFGNNNIFELLSEKYYSCGNGSRTDPSGKVPGNYLNLNEYEKNELLRNFIKEKDLNN